MRLWQRIKHHFVPSHGNGYRPHLLHRPWLVFFFVIILATEGFLVSNLIARQSSGNFLAAVVPAEIIALTNTQRTDNSDGLLTEDALLDKAAQAKADDMAANGYFSHVGPDGKTPWQWISNAGYRYQYAGENLAVRFIDSADVVNAWMASPTHRANIVKPVYTEIGVGVAQGMYEGQSATYVVQDFATPLDNAAPEAPVPQAVAAAVVPAATTTPPAAVSPAPTPVPSVVATSAAAPVKQIKVASSSSTTSPTSIPVANISGAQVEGASIEAAPATLAANNFASYTQSFFRQAMRAFAEPEAVTNWILGLCASILILVIALTFFMHLQIQPTHALMGGAFVALFALSLLGLNTRLSAGGSPNASLTASAAEAPGGGVVIGEEGVQTGYALFPSQ